MDNLRNIPDERSCGPCRACCVHLDIPDDMVCRGPKPARTPCPHLRAEGCNIYATRPDLCAKFQCMWLANPSWPREWRPRESKLLFLRPKSLDGKCITQVIELTPGSLRGSIGERMIEHVLLRADRVVLANRPQVKARQPSCPEWNREVP